MNRDTDFRLRRALKDRRGVAAIVGAVGIAVLMGFAAVSVDAGYVIWAQHTLQTSTTAAALAGAKDIGVGGTPIATATSYSSVTSSPPNLNNIVGVTATMAAGYPALQCFTVGPACSTNQTPATSANGILVVQTATVPLFFAKTLGFAPVKITASAVALAAGQAPPPLNVIFIVDATASMGNTNSSCGTTKLGCAIAGFEALLGELWPCTSNLGSCGTVTNHNVANPVDEAGLLQFPGLQSAPPANYNCSSLTTTSYAGVNGKTNASTASSSTLLHFTATPAFNTGSQALVTDATNPSFIKVGTTITSTTSTTAVMSTTPTTNDTIKSGDAIGVWPPLYQVVPLSSDYRTSDAAATLNASSSLIACLTSMKAPGGYGTFYADAITVAQNILTANARSGARNVIILLSDGEANATSANMVAQGGTTTASNECKAAVTAAQKAAGAGTWVYTVAYGTASSGGCTTDSGSYANACYVMSQITNIPGATVGSFVNDPTKFYSDNANGCQSSAHPNITALKAIFLNIEYSLTTARLLPNACLASPPPGWC